MCESQEPYSDNVPESMSGSNYGGSEVVVHV